MTTYVVTTGFAHERTFRQLVIRQRSEVSWPWYSHGITVSNRRAQRWVANWRLSETAPFVVPAEIEKGPWMKRDPLGDALLADGTLIKAVDRFDETALHKAGLVEQAHCAGVEPRRVVYDRARAHFITVCERGLWRYRVGQTTPLSSVSSEGDDDGFLTADDWQRSGTRLALSGDGRYLFAWRHDDLPSYLGDKDPAEFQQIVVFDIERGESTRWRQDLSEWARIVDVDVDGDGDVLALFCSRDGAAGWKHALVRIGGSVQPLDVPDWVKGCSLNDHVIWLANDALLLFVRHPQLDGHVTIDAIQLRTGVQARSEWRLH